MNLETRIGVIINIGFGSVFRKQSLLVCMLSVPMNLQMLSVPLEWLYVLSGYRTVREPLIEEDDYLIYKAVILFSLSHDHDSCIDLHFCPLVSARSAAYRLASSSVELPRTSSRPWSTVHFSSVRVRTGSLRVNLC